MAVHVPLVGPLCVADLFPSFLTKSLSRSKIWVSRTGNILFRALGYSNDPAQQKKGYSNNDADVFHVFRL